MERSGIGIKGRRFDVWRRGFGIQDFGYCRLAAAHLAATSDNNISVCHGALVVAPPITPFPVRMTAASTCCLGVSAWLLNMLLQFFQLLDLLAQCLYFRILHLEELRVVEKRRGEGRG